jgi:hypothetical protein
MEGGVAERTSPRLCCGSAGFAKVNWSATLGAGGGGVAPAASALHRRSRPTGRSSGGSVRETAAHITPLPAKASMNSRHRAWRAKNLAGQAGSGVAREAVGLRHLSDRTVSFGRCSEFASWIGNWMGKLRPTCGGNDLFFSISARARSLASLSCSLLFSATSAVARSISLMAASWRAERAAICAAMSAICWSRADDADVPDRFLDLGMLKKNGERIGRGKDQSTQQMKMANKNGVNACR